MSCKVAGLLFAVAASAATAAALGSEPAWQLIGQIGGTHTGTITFSAAGIAPRTVVVTLMVKVMHRPRRGFQPSHSR